MSIYKNRSYSSELSGDEEPRAEAGAVLGIFKKSKVKKEGGTEDGVKKKSHDGSKRTKRRKKKEETKAAHEVECTPAPPQTGIFVERWVQRALDLGVEKLREEFRFIMKYERSDMTQAAFKRNHSDNFHESKNRYHDVPCQDQNIVSLVSPPATCDYIHANYVGCPMLPDKRFICCQGPLDQTIDDFWWMVIQNKVEQIVMLCKTVEMGKLKCAQYWPPVQGEKKELKGGALVENVSGSQPMERAPEILVTMLKITQNGNTMSVRHLHWSDWPDRGVPPCKLTSLELLSAVRGSKFPIVVHCSAGIGRTGTIVAIEYILEKIVENRECPLTPEIVKSIRDQRAYSVQNDIQYLFINRVLLHYFLDKYKEKYVKLLTPENIAKYEAFIRDYNAVTGQ